MDGFESFRTQVNELEQKLNDQRLKLEQANGQFNALVAFKQVEVAKLKELQAKIRYENHCLADCEYNTHELLAPYEKMQGLFLCWACAFCWYCSIVPIRFVVVCIRSLAVTLTLSFTAIVCCSLYNRTRQNQGTRGCGAV